MTDYEKLSIKQTVSYWIDWASQGKWFKIPLNPFSIEVLGRREILHQRIMLLRAPENSNAILFQSRIGRDIYLVGGEEKRECNGNCLENWTCEEECLESK
jgi:hypothetical protein